MLYADLHVHSMYSDGTMTIEEILEEADRHQVGLLAVSDHDMLDGARALQKLAKENEKYSKIKCIPSVEINKTAWVNKNGMKLRKLSEY